MHRKARYNRTLFVISHFIFSFCWSWMELIGTCKLLYFGTRRSQIWEEQVAVELKQLRIVQIGKLQIIRLLVSVGGFLCLYFHPLKAGEVLEQVTALQRQD